MCRDARRPHRIVFAGLMVVVMSILPFADLAVPLDRLLMRAMILWFWTETLLSWTLRQAKQIVRLFAISDCF